VSDERKPIEVRRKPWDNDIYEKARLAFEMNHEMSYHEMCGVIERLRAELDTARIYAEQHAQWLNEAVTKQVAAEDEVERLRIAAEADGQSREMWRDKAFEAASAHAVLRTALQTLYDATSTLSALVPDTLAERLLKARDVALAALSEEPPQP
jgi:hypothetical protein